MGRRERVIDPSVGPVAEFAQQLRQLREWAGRPTYRHLESMTHYSATVLSRAAAGERLPSRDVTLAFVAAFLNAVFAFCLGCELYLLGLRSLRRI